MALTTIEQGPTPTRVTRTDLVGGRPKGLIGPSQSPFVMALPDKHLVYVLGHPEAWKLLATLEQGPVDRYEQVRRTLGMHSQAFQRLLYWMRGYGLVRVRAERIGRGYRGAVPVHLEISQKGQAMLGLLRRLEEEVQGRREALGVRTADLLTVA